MGVADSEGVPLAVGELLLVQVCVGEAVAEHVAEGVAETDAEGVADALAVCVVEDVGDGLALGVMDGVPDGLATVWLQLSVQSVQKGVNKKWKETH